MICHVSDVEETRALGRALADLLRPGDLVVLAGPLGAGKTVLAQGIGAGLGVVGPVTSPTFVIARVHRPGPDAPQAIPMVHVDAYRLGAGVNPRAEVDDLDLDATAGEAVTVVEWGEGVVEHLADAHLLVRIDRSIGEEPAPAGAPAPAAGGGGEAGPPEVVAAEAEPREVSLIPRGGDWEERLQGWSGPVRCTRAGARD